MLSVAFVGVFVNEINGYLKSGFRLLFDLVSFNPLVILLLIVFAIISAVLGGLIPLLNLRRYAPKDIVNKGEIK